MNLSLPPTIGIIIDKRKIKLISIEIDFFILSPPFL
jgi:hypothetical protein